MHPSCRHVWDLPSKSRMLLTESLVLMMVAQWTSLSLHLHSHWTQPSWVNEFGWCLCLSQNASPEGAKVYDFGVMSRQDWIPARVSQWNQSRKTILSYSAAKEFFMVVQDQMQRKKKWLWWEKLRLFEQSLPSLHQFTLVLCSRYPPSVYLPNKH